MEKLKAPKNLEQFRLSLQSELVRRMKVNPKYSLRAFARFLELDPSSLSQYLRGRRKFTEKQLEALALKLGLSPMEISSIRRSIKSKTGSEEVWRESNHDLAHDVFQLIADWYHYAIFELATLKDFRPQSRWIAKKLDISASEAEFAVERLLRLGLLVKDDDGNVQQGPINVSTTGNPHTAAAFRKLQIQLLQKAIEAMESVPIEKRDQSSMTMAMDSKKIPEAKERIKQFRRELCDFLQIETDTRDAVYQLSVSFFPLTRLEVDREI
jgi:hypothetical protein